MYWNRAGIYYLGQGENGFGAKNVSENTIQGLFANLPRANKEFATGNYDAVNRTVRWLYNSTSNFDGVTYKYNFDTELILDVVLGAFTKNSITPLDTASPYVAGYVTTPDLINAVELGSSVTKYLVLYYETGSSIPNVTFAHYKDTNFVDWRSLNGVGKYYEGYLLTGYETLGTTMANKQAPYIIVHCKRTENNVESIGEAGGVEYDSPSSCILQSRWDFADSGASGKWGASTEVYRLNRALLLPVAGQPLNYGHSVITTKNRLTGRGKALSLRFSTSSGKDLHILGWGIRYSGNTVI
jgi:hypothetical protein